MASPKLVMVYNYTDNGDYSIRLTLADHFEIDGELISGNSVGLFLTVAEAEEIVKKLQKALDNA